MTSSAGRNVICDSSATRMPIAPIGPSPAVPLTSASDNDNNAIDTVSAEATIAGPALRRARAIASCLSSICRSSSR
jgi:hypothetical protein